MTIINKINKRVTRFPYVHVVRLIICCSTLSSCSYHTKFECSAAKGLYCTSMSKVDQLIDNGNIEKVEIDWKKQRLFKMGKNNGYPK